MREIEEAVKEIDAEHLKEAVTPRAEEEIEGAGKKWHDYWRKKGERGRHELYMQLLCKVKETIPEVQFRLDPKYAHKRRESVLFGLPRGRKHAGVLNFRTGYLWWSHRVASPLPKVLNRLETVPSYGMRVGVRTEADIDEELIGWIKMVYEAASGQGK